MEGATELGPDEVAGVAADEEKAAARAVRELENIATESLVTWCGLEIRFFDLQVVVV